jgi:hypothetical protein
VIGISVSGTTVTFNLSNDPFEPAVRLPMATLEANMLTRLTEADYTVAWGALATCVTRAAYSSWAKFSATTPQTSRSPAS